jgi:hypothetical protein
VHRQRRLPGLAGEAENYVALRDLEADKHGLLWIVDESGDDYLYAKSLFRSIVLPQAVRKALLAAA